jgi:Fur family ferric uptake transcriptional regulator
MDAGRVRHATRQGEAISEVLDEVAEFRTPQEIHAELRRRGRRVGLTTVYRHLAQLADRGAVDVLRTASGQTVYRRCAAEAHHHHLICRNCGTTVEFEGPEVERWAEAVARAARFHDMSHTVEIFGTCDDCDAGRTARRAEGS